MFVVNQWKQAMCSYSEDGPDRHHSINGEHASPNSEAPPIALVESCGMCKEVRDAQARPESSLYCFVVYLIALVMPV